MGDVCGPSYALFYNAWETQFCCTWCEWGTICLFALGQFFCGPRVKAGEIHVSHHYHHLPCLPWCLDVNKEKEKLTLPSPGFHFPGPAEWELSEHPALLISFSHLYLHVLPHDIWRLSAGFREDVSHYGDGTRNNYGGGHDNTSRNVICIWHLLMVLQI